MDLDEAQRNREISLLKFQLEEIEKAQLTLGEDKELEQRYRKMNNSRKIVEALQKVHACTGYDESASAGELLGQAVREVSQVSSLDEELQSLESMLLDIDSLLNDFSRQKDLSFFHGDIHLLQLLAQSWILCLKQKFNQRI